VSDGEHRRPPTWPEVVLGLGLFTIVAVVLLAVLVWPGAR
jgi:hypothetical protein